MQFVIYIFIMLWCTAAAVGMMDPKLLVQLFPSAARILGVREEQFNPKVEFFFRILYGLAFVFGVLILCCMFTGKASF